MNPPPAFGRARKRLRNTATLAGALLRAHIGNEAPPRQVDLQHFPAQPWNPQAAAYNLPPYLDDRQAWVGVLRELYALPIALPTSLSPQAGLFLHALVLNISPRTVVETGTFTSISALWIAAALQSLGGERRLHSFDTFDEPAWRERWSERGEEQPPRSQRELVESSLRRAGFADLVTLHAGDSAALLPAASELRTSGAQLAFIDGDHSEAGTVRDLRALEHILERGGYIVLHDIYPDQCAHRGPRFVIDHLASLTDARYELCEIYTAPANYGMVVMRRLR
jgi:predicted O-methyltransferase YrrM